MIIEKKRKRFEDNENGWFSLWSKVFELKCSQIIINIELKDDHLFNHLTKVKCNNVDVNSIFNESITLFKIKNISPCFYVSDLINISNFEQELIDRGFYLFDTMNVLEHAGKISFGSEEEIKVKLIDSNFINTWIRIFTNSFMISNNQSQEYRRRLNKLIKRPDIDFFLANLNNIPVGCAALFSKNKIGGIYSLGTLNKYRNKGVASKLLNTALDRSQSRDNEYHILQTLDRDASTKFYFKNNFKIAYSKKIYISK